MKKELIEWAKSIVIAMVIACVILIFFKPVVVKQESMQPTFYSDDYIIVNRQAYNLFGDVKRGDVIIFESTLTDGQGHSKNLIKRIIGVPGDTVEIIEGNVYVNGKLFYEDYLAEEGSSGEMAPIQVEEGKIFVMGDNRIVSQDSRSWEIGQVDQDTIVGKVVVRLYPFDSMKFF